MILEVAGILLQPNRNMRWIAGLITIGCLLVGFAIQLTVYQSVTEVMGEPDQPEDPLKEAGVTVVNRTIGDGSMYSPYYLAYSQQGRLTKARTVHFTILKNPKDVLGPGEKLPTEDFMDLYLNSRANYVAQAECELIKETFAEDCAVSYVNAKIYKGVARFSGALMFVAKKRSEFPSKDTKWSLKAPSVKLVKKQKPTSWMTTENKRRRVYKTVEENCEKLRNKLGDCAILAVKVGEHIDRKSGRPILQANAVHGYLQPEGL